MVTLLCIVLALITFMMSMAILIQEPKQSGLSGSFGMGGEQMLGAGSPNAISKFTGALAVVFLGLCLVIGLVDQSAQNTSSIEMEDGDSTGVSPTVEGAGDGEVGDGAVGDGGAPDGGTPPGGGNSGDAPGDPGGNPDGNTGTGG